MVHPHIQIPPESIEIYQKCTLCRVFFPWIIILWCKICTIMNTNIPMSDEIFKKCTFFWGEELLKWRKCLQCDEIWSNISNRIMRGRVGPYGGQEQLLLKSVKNILNVMKYIWLNINNRIIRGRVGTITPINKMVKWKGGMCRCRGGWISLWKG